MSGFESRTEHNGLDSSTVDSCYEGRMVKFYDGRERLASQLRYPGRCVTGMLLGVSLAAAGSTPAVGTE